MHQGKDLVLQIAVIILAKFIRTMTIDLTVMPKFVGGSMFILGTKGCAIPELGFKTGTYTQYSNQSLLPDEQ